MSWTHTGPSRVAGLSPQLQHKHGMFCAGHDSGHNNTWWRELLCPQLMGMIFWCCLRAGPLARAQLASFVQPRSSYLGMVLPIVSWALLHHHQSRQSLTDIPWANLSWTVPQVRFCLSWWLWVVARWQEKLTITEGTVKSLRVIRVKITVQTQTAVGSVLMHGEHLLMVLSSGRGSFWYISKQNQSQSSLSLHTSGV